MPLPRPLALIDFPRLLTLAAAMVAATSVTACGGDVLSPNGVVDGSGQTGGASAPLDLDSPSAAGDYLAGRFALDSGDVHAAAQSFERALSLAPDNVELRRQVFLLKLASGDIDGALAGAEQLAALDPQADEVDLLFALREAKQGRYPASRQRLDQLTQHGVTSLARPVLVAWTDFGQDHVDQALAGVRSGTEN